MFQSKYKIQNEQLIEEVAQQTSIIDAIKRSMAYIEFSPDGKVLDCNDNFLATTGYSLQEIKGKHHRIFCEPGYADSQEYSDFWRDLNRGQFSNGRYKRIKKDGEPLWLEATYNPIFDSNNQLVKVVKFASDITERVQQGMANAGKLEALSRSTAIIEFDKDGIIVDCNDNFLKTVGYQKEAIIGQHHRIFCDSDYASSSEYHDFWRRLNNGEFFSGQFKRVDASRNVLWLEASYNPVYGEDGKLHRVVKFASNITDKTKQAELERNSASIAYRISNETLKVAKDGGCVIESAVAEMNKIAQSILDSSKDIDRLRQQSGEISSIINTIKEIADQTNLLALNAAIEAARAGEQGRGFAVVADEVRQLASRTAQSTSEISSMINNVQKDTNSASTSMEKCLEQATHGVDLANKTGEVFTQIQTGADEVVTAINQFSNSLSA